MCFFEHVQRSACFIDELFSIHVLGKNCVAVKASRLISFSFFLIKSKSAGIGTTQMLDYQEFWTIRHWISGSLLCDVCICICVCECACVLHTLSPSLHLIHISSMLVSQLSHFTVAVSPDQTLSTVPFPWLSSNHIHTIITSFWGYE